MRVAVVCNWGLYICWFLM